MAVNLETLALTELKGVGQKLANTLLKLDIASVQDLLFHLPTRYLDRTRIYPLAELQLARSVAVEGQVLNSQITFGRRRALVVNIEDDSGRVCLRFFHFNAAQKAGFEPGRRVRVYGEPRPGPSGLEFYHPEYEFVDAGKAVLSEERLTPVYALTEGVSQQRLRLLMQQALNLLDQAGAEELLPDACNRRFGIRSLAEALHNIHFPAPDCDVDALMRGEDPVQKRLAFEELLAHFLTRQHMRSAVQKQHAPTIQAQPELHKRFLQNLPFSPTRAQARAIAELQKDLQKGQPMMRMVQGDVGSGKTLVAALCALDVIGSGFQVALAAPTEILAEQHLANFRHWLEPLGISVGALLGSQKASAKKSNLENMASGETRLVIGTHALFQDGVEFAQLGLVIIDEQHRFGVDQRLSLHQKSRANIFPHQLIMTATPIPRTLAMTQYAELDFSIIDELPPGRTPVATAIVSQERRDDVIGRIQHICDSGRQVYWVCPLIEESETLNVANAEERYAELREKLPTIKVALVHGRMKSQDKDAVMKSFKSGEVQMLVATTVIEVGVDVPNASLMIIENPERLGLAQLHQLRGRVGRGTAESHCVLLYGKQLSQRGRERLKILREYNDGFAIAEKDLLMRGPGEFFGTRQAGAMYFRIADVERDAQLLEEVHSLGRKMLSSDPARCDKLIDRWFGQRRRYALA